MRKEREREKSDEIQSEGGAKVGITWVKIMNERVRG